MRAVTSIGVGALCVLLLGGGAPARAAEDGNCPSGAIDVPVGASLQALVAAAVPGAQFCIAAGIHRGPTVVPKRGQSFFGRPGSIVNGADVLTHFERVKDTWVATAPRITHPKRGECKKDRPACEFPVGVFIDDRALQQVASASAVAPGLFAYDRGRSQVVIGEDPRGRTVEITVRDFAFRGRAGDVRIRGLIVEKYFSPAQEGAIQGAFANGWQIEHTEFRQNSGAGVTVGTGGTVSDCRIHHNGQLGIGATGSDIRIERNTIWANNTLGFDYTWEAGGVKVAKGERIVFRENQVRHNGGPGLWCDIDCRDVLFEDNVVEFNDDAGIFFEISQSAVIRRNVLRENGQDRGLWFWGPDILVAASQGVEVHGNRVTTRPGGKAIMLIDQNRPSNAGGYYKTRNNVVHDNEIVFLGAGVAGGASDAKPGDANVSIIENGDNRFVSNNYVFRPPNAPVFMWGNQKVDFEGFRNLGQERGGNLEGSR